TRRLCSSKTSAGLVLGSGVRTLLFYDRARHGRAVDQDFELAVPEQAPHVGPATRRHFDQRAPGGLIELGELGHHADEPRRLVERLVELEALARADQMLGAAHELI